ncbi:MAG: PAS domain S-box protein [Tindallia sp. MSAO_Bac2]|nr:MAG: PAS domain S-box protein [Tindallia sp. MSAO_Bac2]
MMTLALESQEKITRLFESLKIMTGLTAALMDQSGQLLASSDPQPVCREFHRVNEDTYRQCVESEKTHCRMKHQDQEEYVLYTCPLGIGNAVMNITQNGQKIGCVFGGQFFLEPPDLDFFAKQAELYGFDKKIYLEKIKKVPVISKEKLLLHLRMVHRLAAFAISVELTKDLQAEEEQELIKSNEELEKTFQLLQDSEQQLRNQYEELLVKERMLRETEERYAFAVEGSRDGVWDWHIPTGKNYVSHRWSEMLGYEPSQAKNTFSFFKSLIHPEDISLVDKTLDGFMNGEYEQWEYEFRMKAANGSYRWIRSRGKVFEWDADGKPQRVVGTQTDVTENRQLEQKLEESQRRIEVALDASGDGWWDTNYETGKAVISDNTKEIWGIESNNVSPDTWKQLIHPEDRDRIVEEEKEKFSKKQSFNHQYRILRPDGTIRWVLDRGRAVDYDDDGNILRVSGMLTDITEKIKKSSEFERQQKELEALFDYSPDALVYSSFQNGKNIIRMINRRFEEIFGYSEEEAYGKDLDQLVVPEKNMTEGRQISAAPYHNQHFEGRGLRKKKNGETVPVIIRVGPAVVDKKVVGAQGSYTDISKLIQTENQLRKTLKDTVRSLSRISEKRDLYTADHQKRVAGLASAIGKALGWGEHRVEGLRTAALLHDIGKIMIPSEILSKPSRLTKLEFEYIKTHPQNAYDILKNIEFEWPVADMVLQHHERIDGSGYPQGLQKNDILPEARILIIADVVEAISSHRPYRPALGIDVALKEIQNRKDSWYDDEMAEICLALFQDGSFDFE